MIHFDRPSSGFSGEHPGAETASPIPVARIREKLDSLTGIKDYSGAARLLEYWSAEAQTAKDLRGLFVVLNEMMGVYRKMECREKALESADQALALIPVLGCGSTISAGTAYVNAGTVCDCFGAPERAVGYFREAQKIYESSLDRDDGRLGALYNNMALALADLDRHEEAFHYYELALDIMGKQPLGKAEQAITLLNMANAAEAARGMEEAEDEISRYLQSAETLLQDPSLPRNGYYAFVCEKCAPTFSYYGWFGTAADLEQEADTIRRSLSEEGDD